MLEELSSFLLVNMQTYNLSDQVEGPLKKGRWGLLQKVGFVVCGSWPTLVCRNSVLPTVTAWQRAGHNERKFCSNTSILEHWANSRHRWWDPWPLTERSSQNETRGEVRAPVRGHLGWTPGKCKRRKLYLIQPHVRSPKQEKVEQLCWNRAMDHAQWASRRIGKALQNKNVLWLQLKARGWALGGEKENNQKIESFWEKTWGHF